MTIIIIVKTFVIVKSEHWLLSKQDFRYCQDKDNYFFTILRVFPDALRTTNTPF